MAEFDQFANNYKKVLDRSTALAGESSEYFTEYKAAYIDRLLDGFSPAKILDFGCGVGTLSSALAKHRPADQIHGFDVSIDSLDQIEPSTRSRGLFTSQRGDLHRDYDLIVISNVMHHIAVDQRQSTIVDLAGRLSDHGRLLVIEHNPLNPMTRWVVSRCEFDDDAILLSPGEVKKYFRAANMCRFRRDYIVFFPNALSVLRRFEPALAWLPAGAQYALTATKNH